MPYSSAGSISHSRGAPASRSHTASSASTPTAPASVAASTAAGSRSYATTVCPAASVRSTTICPIRPSPMTPSSMRQLQPLPTFRFRLYNTTSKCYNTKIYILILRVVIFVVNLPATQFNPKPIIYKLN